jgi:hypothetical protein
VRHSKNIVSYLSHHVYTFDIQFPVELTWLHVGTRVKERMNALERQIKELKTQANKAPETTFGGEHTCLYNMVPRKLPIPMGKCGRI